MYISNIKLFKKNKYKKFKHLFKRYLNYLEKKDNIFYISMESIIN